MLRPSFRLFAKSAVGSSVHRGTGGAGTRGGASHQRHGHDAPDRFGNEEPFIDALLARYRPRISEAKAFALRHRVLLLSAENGSGIDIALGALPFEELAVSRSTYVIYADGIKLRICSPEDLIVMKAFASREQDWTDVRMTIVRKGVEALDWRYIREQLAPLAEVKDAPEIMERLKKLRKHYANR